MTQNFLGPKFVKTQNFSTRYQVDYLTVGYFESSWNLEYLELECGPAQPDLYFVFIIIDRTGQYARAPSKGGPLYHYKKKEHLSLSPCTLP